MRRFTPALVAAPLLLLGCPAGDAASEGEGEGEEGEGEEGEGEGEEGEGEEGEGEEGEGEGEEGEGEGDDACGDVVVDGSGIVGTEGVVVGRDGTVYFSQSEGVGRRLPDGTLELDWLALPGADTVWGVMLSPDNSRLYVGGQTTSLLYVVDVEAAVVLFSLDDFGGPNGVTVDDDGFVFVSDFFDDAVYRFDGAADAAPVVELVTDDVATPNGLLVDGDDLLVLGYNDGHLYRAVGGRLGLASSTTSIAQGLGNPDGIVRADDGSFFVTDNGGGHVVHVVGATVDNVADGIGAAANLEFGTAPLRCDRLLVTSSGALRVLDVGGLGIAGGAPVPWR